MYKKSMLLIVALGLFAGPAAHAANIIWVGETDDQNADGTVDDAQWPVWLGEQGYLVDSQPNNWLVLDAAKVDLLNQADLVIISRNTDSGDYINGNEATLWNSVTSPMIMLTSYLSRANRWRWVNADGLTNLTGSPAWEAVVAAHPIFSGVQLNANQVTAIDGSVSSLGTYHIGAAVGTGNGTLLARVAGTGEKAIIEWEPGVEFFAGGPVVAARRLVFCAGTTESGTSFPQGAFNLTADGQKLLLNAIRYMLGEDTQKGLAAAPAPQDEAMDVPFDGFLSWTSGEFAAQHDVYLGAAFDDVSSASRAKPLGVLASLAQDANTYDPAGALAFGQTYYWRVDEVNAAPDFTVIKGDVWSFTVEPLAYPLPGASITATASSVNSADMGPERTIDGSGLDAAGRHSVDPTTMWLSNKAEPQPAWIQYAFDKAYKLHELHVWNSNQVLEESLGVGAKAVKVEYSVDGTAWTALGEFTVAQASGTAVYAANTTIDFGEVVAKYVKLTIESNWGGLLSQCGLSEVRFSYVPVWARESNPAAGATDANPQVTLQWRSGREAASHKVYVSPDQQAVKDGTAPVATTSEPAYATAVDLGQTYYWKVVEVNHAQNPSSWEGDVWSFSTREHLVVDDFESYTDHEGSRIYETWIDGWEDPTNGSQVGYGQAPFAEQVNMHGGKQSMPLGYENTSAAYSEAERTLGAAQDWTKHGITTLAVNFAGNPGNTGGRMYVKINGTKVLYTGDASVLTKPWWTQWNINLASTGANLKSVTKLTIGIEGAGAAGLVFVDDIRLYKSAPQAASEMVWLEAESAKAIPIYWDLLSDDADASGGKYMAVKAGNNSMEAPPADGTLSYTFTVKGGVYTLQARTIVPTADDNSLWLRIQGATTQTTNHVSGWVWWYDIAGGSNWHWDTVRSNNDAGQTVQFTLPAGTYTLEVAYREDGLLVDAFVLSDQLD